MSSSVDQWLEQLGLGKYTDLFEENEIDLAALPYLSEDDLKEIGVALGVRRKLLAAIETLASQVPADDPTNPPTTQRSSEAEFLNAIEISRHQEARAWEIRGATRLAQRWSRQGQDDRARELLTPIHNGFSEGFGSTDMLEARALLDAVATTR